MAKKLRGKAPETLLSEALVDLQEHEREGDETKIAAARTRVIALKQRVAAGQKYKKADKIAALVKALEDKFAALEGRIAVLEAAAVKSESPVIPVADAETVSTGETTLERMRRSAAAKAQLGQVELPRVEPAVKPVEPRVETLAQPQPAPPVVDKIEAKVARIKADAKRNAPTPNPNVAAIEASEQRIAELQKAGDGYQQTLAVEAVFPPKAPEETAALDLVEERYGDSPEARAQREQRAQAVIADAQKAKEPLPDPSCDAIKAIEAEVVKEAEAQERLRAAQERVAKLRAQVQP
jgi:hypothetical protein